MLLKKMYKVPREEARLVSATVEELAMEVMNGRRSGSSSWREARGGTSGYVATYKVHYLYLQYKLEIEAERKTKVVACLGHL